MKTISESQKLSFLSGQQASLMMEQLMPATADVTIKDRNPDLRPAAGLEDVCAHVAFLSHSSRDYLPLIHLANQFTIIISS